MIPDRLKSVSRIIFGSLLTSAFEAALGGKFSAIDVAPGTLGAHSEAGLSYQPFPHTDFFDVQIRNRLMDFSSK